MKGVPGVIVLLSNNSDLSLTGMLMPCLANSSLSRSSSFSWNTMLVFTEADATYQMQG